MVRMIMKNLNDNPQQRTIDFEQLNNNGRINLLLLLKSFFESTIAELSNSGKFKLVFKVNGNAKQSGYYSKPLTPEICKPLLKNLNDKNFIFDIDNQPP